jgi:hypothetical protein
LFGHSGTQAQQFTQLSMISRAIFSQATLLAEAGGQLAGRQHLVPDRHHGLLDRLHGVFAIGLDAGGFEIAPGFVADLGTEHHFAAGERLDGAVEDRFGVAAGLVAAAVLLGLAVADELDAPSAEAS